MSDNLATNNRGLEVSEVRTRNRIRVTIATTITRALLYSIAGTFLVILLNGFGLWGFHLTESFLNWLGGATIGQVAALLAMIIRQK
jgi:hypothetical protein